MAIQNSSAVYSEIQKKIFDQIKQLIPPNNNIVDELAELLHVSLDSSYRRLRGETILNLQEIAMLCETYDLSLDKFLYRDSGMVSFKYKPFTNDEQSFIDYLIGIRNNLWQIQKSGKGEVFYAAEDIPFFHLFSQSHLAAFKCFYWMKSVMNLPSFEEMKFDASLIKAEILELGKEIIHLYSLIPSTEIWSEITINSLVKQIEFYFEAGLFKNPSEALIICDQFLDLLGYIRKQAEYGCKYVSEAPLSNQQQNFKLYNCEVEIGNNCILVDQGSMKSVFITHHTFNTLNTNNIIFCDETSAWFKNLLSKSILLSGVAEKQRYKFFDCCITAVEQLKRKVTV